MPEPRLFHNLNQWLWVCLLLILSNGHVCCFRKGQKCHFGSLGNQSILFPYEDVLVNSVLLMDQTCRTTQLQIPPPWTDYWLSLCCNTSYVLCFLFHCYFTDLMTSDYTVNVNNPCLCRGGNQHQVKDRVKHFSEMTMNSVSHFCCGIKSPRGIISKHFWNVLVILVLILLLFSQSWILQQKPPWNRNHMGEFFH